MSADERARAFDRFWHRRGSGAGLGLAIARRLAAADGGQTRLDVADGGGVDAVVSLRRA
jgi:signal transduction histidine kinase